MIVRGDRWLITSVAGGGAGTIPPGAEPTIHRLSTIEEAQAAVPFTLHTPAYLPPGRNFREALVTPDQVVYLFYGEPVRELIVCQGRAEAGDKMAASTNGPVENVTVNGIPAVWLQETKAGGLVWESEGFVFEVDTADQPMSEVIRVAESLR